MAALAPALRTTSFSRPSACAQRQKGMGCSRGGPSPSPTRCATMSLALNSFISAMKLTPTLGPCSVRSAM
eukprot:7471871-Alexandrium_andersonii.AAC.1